MLFILAGFTSRKLINNLAVLNCRISPTRKIVTGKLISPHFLPKISTKILSEKSRVAKLLGRRRNMFSRRSRAILTSRFLSCKELLRRDFLPTLSHILGLIAFGGE